MCHGQTHGQTQRESYPHDSLNHLYGAFLPDFFWLIILISLGLSPCLMHLRILPCVCPYLLAKMDFSREAYGELDTTPLLTSKEIFSQKGLLDFENGKYVVFYLSRAQSLLLFSCCSHLGVQVRRDQLQLLTLGPFYLLHQIHNVMLRCSCPNIPLGVH